MSLQPEVARSFPRISRDGRRYSIPIRPGYRFSPPSNERVTAETFKYTIERALSPAMHSYARNIVDDVVGEPAYESGRARHISGISAKDNVLTITLTRPNGSLAARLAAPFFCAVPVGTPRVPTGVPTVPSAGPDYVSSYSTTAGFVLKRNPNYRGPRPRYWNEIVYSIGSSLAGDARVVEQNRADYAPILPGGVASELSRRFGAGSAAAKRGAQQFFRAPALAVFYLALNTRRPLFANEAARRAVNYAIDRTRLSRLPAGSLIDAGLIASDQYLPIHMPTFHAQHTYGVHADLRRARRTFDFGRRTAVFYTCDDAVCASWARVLRGELGRVGLTLKTRTFPLSKLEMTTSTRGEPFDLTSKGWWADYADPSDFLNVLLDGRSIQARNNNDVSYFESSLFERRLDAASRLSGAARTRAYSELAHNFAENAAPWIPVATIDWYSFFSARIGCQVLHPIYYVDLGALCVRR
jgi:ABC-type oligopeptide transport system substrate-binding subunit